MDVARGAYDLSSAAYVNRFGEEYSLLSDLYRGFEEVKESPEFDIEQRIKDLSAADFSFKIWGLLFIGLLVLLLFAMEHVVRSVKHYFFNGMLL